MNRQGSMEVLLLLCCLVGVVAFLCFGMGLIGLTSMTDEEPSPDLDRPVDSQAGLRDHLAERAAELERTKSATHRLEEARDQKEQELGTLVQSAACHDYAQNDREALMKEIEAADDMLASLRNRRAQEGAPANQFNPWRDFKGSEVLRNPLFVECRKDNMVLIDGNSAAEIALTSVENPFPDASSGHDAIVFLIRPDGFESFEKASAWAEKTDLMIGYEPIDSDWRLDFSR